ncbi:MAG TPA: ATP-binding protein [Aminobacterium sp.]|uniref:Mrp/NBP35 family ATP-binding protein n=1 Tax=Aminobacterium TaxID=81466 RepID=UPI000EBB955F|nr:Mrp/NBP35 family ATP-binding protein [Aminobacterium sp. UBA4834]HCA40385.1 ATP-binding protein [Aminobacterium sp.]
MVDEMCSHEACGKSSCEGCSGCAKKKKNVKHVIAVGSGKGGVGKSSISSLLAVALAQKGYSVGVLDADITGPSIPKLFGITDTPLGRPEGIIPPASPVFDVRVMSINLLLDDPTKPVVWRGPIIGNVIKQFWEEVAWDDRDFVIVDLPPGTADAPLTVMQTIDLDGFLVVTSPQELSVMIVEKALNMTQMMEVPLLGVVENMSYLTCPDCGKVLDIFGPSHVEEIGEKYQIPVIGRFPLDPELGQLADSGRIEEYKNHLLLETLAEGVLERLKTAVHS